MLCSPDERPVWQVPTADPDSGLPSSIVDVVRQLDQRLSQSVWPETPRALPVRLDQAAFAIWEPYSKALTYDLLGNGLDDRLSAAYGRLPTQALKVATILAALDWGGAESQPRIATSHMVRAISIGESWRASFHRLLDVTVQTTANVRRGRVIRQVAAAGTIGLSLRDLGRRMRDIDIKDLRSLVDDALTLGELEEIQRERDSKGGRPTIRYRLASGVSFGASEVLSGTSEVSS